MPWPFFDLVASSPPHMSSISGLKSVGKPTQWKQDQGPTHPTGTVHVLHFANVKYSSVQGFQLEPDK